MGRSFKDFAAAKRGNVAMLFGIAALPLVLAVGAAVDYSSAASIQSHLQSDIDATALAACKSKLTTTSELRNLAQQMLNGYMPDRTVTITSFTATTSPRNIAITARVTYSTRFVRIASINSMDISASSSCAAGENFFEIALVLDTTQSMTGSAGTGTKIEALRTAATNFVNSMFTDNDPTHVKIAVVPFAASVKLDPNTYAPNNTPASSATWLDTSGTSPIHWQNVINPAGSSFTNRFDIFKKLKSVNSDWTWAGCMESLPYPYNTQDASPSSATPGTRYVPMLAPDEVGTNRQILFWTTFDDGSSNPVNSYINDGSSTSGSCNSLNSVNRTRMGQACKYVSPASAASGGNSGPGPNWGCTSRAITRLTNVQSDLTTEIGKLTADGNTNIAEGLHWGWRTITRTGVFTDASDYGTANTTKIIILMTDGVNTWNQNSNTLTKSDYSAYGYFQNADSSTTTARLPSGYGNLSNGTDARNALDQLTRETCTNMKAKNVVIYSVAFSTPGSAIDASGQQLIQDCASSTDRYFLASDAASLNATFAAIAKGIGALRITR